MAGFDDIAKSVGGFVEQNQDKIGEALKSEQAEGISDKILDGAADAANKVTGDKFKDQIAGARDAADKAVGNE
ncbi:MAG TPA: Rv0909 family putative TA system antitoxin [Microbacteriaceae bacterium]